jgi:hypothetical protein
MLEIIAYIVFGFVFLALLLAAFTIFVSYVTQADYMDLVDDSHCASCRTYNCLACKCDDQECCR